MRILILARLFPPEVGGLQTYSEQLARECQALGHQVLVLCPHAPEDQVFDSKQPYRIVRLPGTRWRWVKTLAFGAGYLAWAFRFRPDLTLATIWAPCGFVAALGQLGLSIPFFTFFHGTEIGLWQKRRLAKPLLTWTVSRSARLIANSHFTAERLKALGKVQDRLHVILCGVELGRFQPAPARYPDVHGRRILLSIAALVPRKGIDQVILALPQMLAKIPHLCYRIGGAGPDRGRLEALVAQQGLQKHVEFLGRLSDEEVVAQMNSCEVFVMPSRQIEEDYEGFGIVFLEANACGKPVVAGRSGGIPDAVIDGSTGFLVDPLDPGAIAQAVVKLLQDEALARRMSEQARLHAHQFTWERVAREVLALSESLGDSAFRSQQ